MGFLHISLISATEKKLSLHFYVIRATIPLMELDFRTPELLDYCSQPLVKRISSLSPELTKLSFEELKLLAKPDERVELLREAFWVEYERSIAQDRKVQACNVYDGICNRDQWYDINRNDYRMAYIITPTAKYEARIQIILKEKAVPILNQILDAQMLTEDGLLDIGIATLKVRVIKQLEDRLKGTPIQRSENKEFRVNANIKTPDSMEDLKKRIEDLDGKLASVATTNSYLEFKKNEKEAEE